MRAFGQAGLCDGHVVIGGQHGNGDVAGHQRVGQRRQTIGADVGGQVAHRVLRLGNGAVPHHNLMALCDQRPQSGGR